MLGTIYKRLGIRNRRPDQVYIKSRADQLTLKSKRRSFAKKLKEHIDKGHAIIFADETTVDNHIRTAKCWSYANKPIKQILEKKRYGGVTIFGAIGYCLNKPVFTLGKSTNKEDF